MLPSDDKKDPKSQYYEEASKWNEEIYDSAIKGRRIGWFVAAIAGFIAVCLSIGIVILMPLKEVVPYTIEVNKLTGETRVARPLQEGNLTQSEALSKYWIIKYVKARIGYDRQDVEQKYELVKMMTEPREFDRFNRAFNPRSETSPYQVYGEKNTAEAKIKSISFIDKDTASIRIDLVETINDRPEVSPWVVVMSFQYTLDPKTEAERFDNPLGFQATKWRIDEEVEQGELE